MSRHYQRYKFEEIAPLVLVEHLPKDSVKSFSAKEPKESPHSIHGYVKMFGQVINPSIWQLIFVLYFQQQR